MTSAATSTTGLGILDNDEVDLLRALDTKYRAMARESGAIERRYPFLLDHRDLDAFDYFDNFPHLGLFVAPAQPLSLATELSDKTRPIDQVTATVLQDPAHCLPSAACYSVYLGLRETELGAKGETVTTVATCFRHEDHYDGLRRLLGFTMREIVYIGTEDGAKAHLKKHKSVVAGLLNRLGIEPSIETATDPFFDRNGSRAMAQRLFPVKEEFIVDDLAIASVNYHRNFFGERCNISLADGSQAHTSCVAFGIERWIHVLTAKFGSASAAIEALTDVDEAQNAADSH